MKSTSLNSTARVISNVSTVTKDSWGRNILQYTLRAPTLQWKKKESVTNAKRYSVIESAYPNMTCLCTALKHFSATFVRKSFLFAVSLRYTKGESILNRETSAVRSVQKSFSANTMSGRITMKFTVTTSRINVTCALQNLSEIQHGATTESPI